MQLRYAIKFVADMDAAIAFYRDTLGLTLRFATPGWSEFDTGETTLALHIASETEPAGHVQLGFGPADVDDLFARRQALGLTFLQPPRPTYGHTIAGIADCEGAEIRISS